MTPQGYAGLDGTPPAELLRIARLLHYSRPDGSYGGDCPACQGRVAGSNGGDPVCEVGCTPDEVRAGLQEAAIEELRKAAGTGSPPW